jgi:AcrR family transcriptional regulator
MPAKVDRGQATRAHVLETATRLFAARGYDATSIEDVLAATSLSRGALYHHFPSKEALFEAVLDAVEAEIAQLLGAARAAAGPIEGLRVACDAFLKLAGEQKIRQIVLIDAPAVVGWQKWREIDARHGFGRMKASVKAAAAQGRVPAELVETYAHIMLAALFELALLVARAENPKAALKTNRAAMRKLIDGLLGPDDG